MNKKTIFDFDEEDHSKKIMQGLIGGPLDKEIEVLINLDKGPKNPNFKNLAEEQANDGKSLC